MPKLHLLKLSFFVLSLLLLTACDSRNSRQNDGAQINLETAVSSTEVGETILRITVSDLDGSPINDAAVSVKGDMSHAGMVPVLAESSSGDNGVYEMPFEWTMGGKWIVTVTVKLRDGRSATQEFDFNIIN